MYLYKKETMNHFMLDLETMGTRPYSVIASIGCVAFDIRTGETGAEFYQTIDHQSCLDAGLTTDRATVEWWKQQDPKVKAQLYINTQPLKAVLADFANWFRHNNTGKGIVWGNSAAFDCGLLNNAYEKCSLSLPWSHWNERCLRTVAALKPRIKLNAPKPPGLHHPIVDCKHQVKYLVKTLDCLYEAEPEA